MTKAIAFSSYGAPDVLEMIDVEQPEPDGGQVRVRVKAAGVQPFDTRVRRGDLRRWVPVSFPQTLGNAFAGVVDKAGRGVEGIGPGSEVVGFTSMRAYAESVVVGASEIASKPPGMPWEEAGVLSAAGQTAHIALEELNVGEGDTVLVHAAGGVGTFAVQLARQRGATVVGTAGEWNHEYLRGLGTIPVAYGPGLVDRVRTLAPRGIDAALDAIGGEAIPVTLELLDDRKRIGTIADHAGAAKYGIRVVSGGARTAERLANLGRLYASGELRVHIHNAYPLTQVPEAHREVETGHVRGKVVPTVGGRAVER